MRDHAVVSGISVIIGPSDHPYGILGAHTTEAERFRKTTFTFAGGGEPGFASYRAPSRLGRDSPSRHLARTSHRYYPRCVVSIDRRGCIVLFNAAAERVFGYSAGEIVGRRVNDLMAEPYAAEHDHYIARYERTGEPCAIGRIRTVE